MAATSASLPMISIFLFLLILPRTLSAVLQQPHMESSRISCTEVETIIRSQFDDLVELQRRGPSEEFIAPHFHKYISDLLSLIVPNPGSVAPSFDTSSCRNDFLRCCFTSNDETVFDGINNGTQAHAELTNLLAIDSNLFYLPSEKVATLPALTADETKVIEQAWTDAKTVLSISPTTSPFPTPSMPPTLDILYDPNRQDACDEFNRINISSAPTIPATDFIRHLLSITLRSVLLGVESSKAQQPLLNGAMYVFLGIRCHLKQRENLLVPTILRPFYENAVLKYSAEIGVDEDSVPDIPDSLIDDSFEEQVLYLSGYSSWGRVEHIVSDGSMYSVRNITQELFNNRILSDLTDELREVKKHEMTQKAIYFLMMRKFELLAPDQASLMEGLLNVIFGEGEPSPLPAYPDPNLKVVFRTLTCHEDYYASVDPLTDLSECCANICQDSALILTVGVTSPSQCCGLCNQGHGNCVLDENNALSQLAAVHLIPYEGRSNETIPVTI